MTFSGPVVLTLCVLAGGSGFLQGKVGLYTAFKKLVSYFQKAKAAVAEVHEQVAAPTPVEPASVPVEVKPDDAGKA